MHNNEYNKHIQDFTQALNIYENEYTHNDLIQFLKSGTIAQKQAACLMLRSIDSKSDAEIFMDNLTGCDGKIREAVSFRLPEFVPINPEYFIDFHDIFLEAIIDINGNICRNTISALHYLKKSESFIKNFCPKLVQKTFELAQRAKSFDIQDGKYKINKEIFKLYWYLETLYVFVEIIESSILKEILSQTKQIQDYTIREKTAKILSKLADNNFDDIRQTLKQDDNYYVKRLIR